MFDSLSAADLDRDTVAGATTDELFSLVRGIHEQRRELDLAEAIVLAAAGATTATTAAPTPGAAATPPGSGCK